MSFTLTRSLTAVRSCLPCTSLHPFLRSTYSTTTNEQHIQRKLPLVRPHRFKEFDLADRVYAVTGGGRGLGLAMAEALMEAGAKVYCLDRLEKPHPEFETAKGQAEKEYGGALEYRRIDVRNEPEVNDVFAEIASRDKRLDGLIAAAGINHLQSALEHSRSALNEVMQINYNGVFNSATAAARQMFKYQQKGSILLVASISGLIANKGMTSPVYNSSKAAVIQLARSLAMEWGRQGIRVNSLCPGHILTPMVEQVFEQNPAAKAIWEAENMLGRLACPEEFRGAALFALSDASSFMTGSTMIIDGGHTAW
ncbi:putative short chain dehydrogenase/oxidoreductase [Aspergillus novofumigatus IBT 16806]|uniref:Putative short chain dehydrogenase/oxidoreductase n=1 Tax=Aspergillus novofumigatus (strain IBT 16806) TaxID=1392255 RepID=A0A2I1CP64_ASPN1|nr:putative short chain dehydrogenase/oxidoreductase [Aspergillus novofumigatus IBT 16806]PKX99402.1 putative short chain dehydrogenase/oxidoreductase [Aspergillus novofumigatus IBT 16806]